MIKTFSQQDVHDAAANLFWKIAEKKGVDSTCDAVIKSAGKCLLSQPFTASILDQYDVDKSSKAVQLAFCNAIAAEAERYTVDEKNMDGIVYTEDAEAGRSPSAIQLDTSLVKALPKLVKKSSEVQSIGRLCLRHPLPAVVFSEKAPETTFFEVEDTTMALGYHLPMFLFEIQCQQIGDDLFLSKGIFRIPVPDVTRGNMWANVIQNSTRFVHQLELVGAASLKIEVTW
jgi:hypothetical protein